jgi:gliding motility-associated-like protein
MMLKGGNVFLLLIFVRLLSAQSIGDCIGAQVICSDSTFFASTNSPGVINDFANPNNSKGCLETGESQSGAWYYFEFRKDLPDSLGSIEFTITPMMSNSVSFADYDFAIYGADLTCDSLGKPLRCSYSWQYENGPQTGLRKGSTETSEGINGTGFLAPLPVKAGEGFYLFIDYFSPVPNSGFEFKWGGPAAPYLNCIVNPNCSNASIFAGNDTTLCIGTPPFQLAASTSGIKNITSIQWSGSNVAWLNQTNVLNPLLSIPPDFSGDFQLMLTIAEGECIKMDTLSIRVDSIPTLNILSTAFLCPSDSITLTAATGFSKYQWSTGSTANTISVKTAGSYTLYGTTSSGCKDSATIEIELKSPVFPVIQGDSLLCSGSTIALSIPTSYSNIVWSGGTPLISAPGTYSVSATDTFGCLVQDTITISGVNTIPAKIIGDSILCGNDPISLSADGSFQTYRWSTGQTTKDISVQTQGIYILETIDSNGCGSLDSLFIPFFPSPQPQMITPPIICEGLQTVLMLTNPYASYLWSDGSDSAALIVSKAGNYSVTVTDINGCQGDTSFFVNLISAPDFQIQGSFSFCTDSSTTLSVPSGFTQYLWSTGETDSIIKIDTAGTYYIDITNSMGCTTREIFEVQETKAKSPVIDTSMILCTGDTLWIDLGFSFKSYTWNGMPTGNLFPITTQGAYNVEVEDDSGCKATGKIMVSETAAAAIEIKGDTLVCPQFENPLAVSSTSLSLIQSFEWSDGQKGAQIKTIGAGTFSVTTTDINGCKAMDTIVVSEKPVPQIDLIGNPYFCPGDSTLITVNAPSSVNLLWAHNNSNASSIFLNQAGTYEVQVVENISGGCIFKNTITIDEKPNPTFQILGDKGICPGSFTELTTDSIFPKYSWSNGDSTPLVQLDSAGLYQLTITDMFGCTASDTVSVFNYPGPNINPIGPSQVCQEEEFIYSLDQTFPLIVWNDTFYSEFFTGIGGGIYKVSVVDSNQCKDSRSFAIQEFPIPLASIQGDTFFCSGSSVTLFPQVSHPQYLWGNGTTLDSVTVDQEGWMTLEVKDINGCGGRDSIFIRKIATPIADAGPDQSITCSDSIVFLRANTALNKSDVVYFWSGGPLNNINPPPMGPTLTVTSPSNYVLFAKDTTFNCISPPDIVFVFNFRDIPNAIIDTPDTITCNTPEIILNGSNSDIAKYYNYDWFDAKNNQLGGPNLLNLRVNQPGEYMLKLTDVRNGCTDSFVVEVIQNTYLPSFSAGPDQWLNCKDQETILRGSLDSSFFALDYYWTDSIGDTIPYRNSKIQPIVDYPSYFILHVNNAENGCTDTDTVRVSLSVEFPEADAGPDQTLACNINEVVIGSTPTGSSPLLLYKWTTSTGNFTSFSSQIPVRDTGLYYLEVTNSFNFCRSFDTVFINRIDNQPPVIDWDAFSTTCFGDKDGWIQATNLTGGQGPFRFSLNGGSFVSTPVFEDLSGGNYRILVRDKDGCESDHQIIVPEGNQLTVDLGPDRIIELGQGVRFNPSISIPLTQVADIYWQPDTLNQCPVPGCERIVDFPMFNKRYTITVVDANGCKAFDEVLVLVVRNQGIYIPNAFSPNNDGVNDQFLILGNAQGISSIKNLTIFTRWGEKVFEASNFLPNDPGFAWDGTHKGKVLNAQVLVYQVEIEYINGENERMAGDLHLIR